MAYVKPGVEITQTQKTFSPTLITPDLGAVIVGPAYLVVNAYGDGSYSYPTYTAGMTVTLSGLNGSYLDKDSVYVDLDHKTGIAPNYTPRRMHIDAASLTGNTDGGSSFTIASGVADTTWNGASVLVGYRALRTDLGGMFISAQSSDERANIFGAGQEVLDNPLPYAMAMAEINTPGIVYGIAVKADDFAGIAASGTVNSEHNIAIDSLTAQEVYAITPLTSDVTTLSAYQAHVMSLSVATEKKERSLIQSQKIVWKNSDGVTNAGSIAAADKLGTARGLRDVGYGIGKKRVFNIVPDVTYQPVLWPVQKLSPTYMTGLYGRSEPALLANNTTIVYSDGTTKTYNANTEITATVYAQLKLDVSNYTYNALVPVPATLAAAAVAGQFSGEFPEQGLTNLPIGGLSKMKYSNDYFSEAQLNTMAEGGNYILVQVGNNIVCRHQLSTDMTSIQTREASITRSMDYTAKFIRKTISGYVGRSLITPSFINIMRAILTGLGSTLVQDGRLNGFNVLSVAQDAVALDTIRVGIEILPKYPVNYIKIELIF